jgi:hypothetical protein
MTTRHHAVCVPVLMGNDCQMPGRQFQNQFQKKETTQPAQTSSHQRRLLDHCRQMERELGRHQLPGPVKTAQDQKTDLDRLRDSLEAVHQERDRDRPRDCLPAAEAAPAKRRQ